MASKDDIIADLRRRNAQQIDDLTKRIAELELQLAKASKNSSNSSNGYLAKLCNGIISASLAEA